MNYEEFIRQKSQGANDGGFEPLWMPDFLFDFQRSLVEWALRKGRAAIFADCGLGKGPMALVWAENVARKTGKPVLVLAPLAVSRQFVREGEKFGIQIIHEKEGKAHRLTVTNYERLHYFSPDDFGGVVCDEISTLKAFDGKRRKQVTRFLSKVPYRLGCTATPSPNDFIELGTISEALGYMTQSDMLGHFFKSDDNQRHSLFKEGDFWNAAKWFFKAHAEKPFWRWVCSWARALRNPADLGFDGSNFILPPLVIRQQVVTCSRPFDGELFVKVAKTLREQRQERRITMQERCARVADLVRHDEPSLVWCQYNEEGDILADMIPDAVQVAGADTDEDKEERLAGFAEGKFRVLVCKPKIGAWGLNYQHCGHHTFFPSHSFEQFYQSVRRSLRFGRVGPVRVDIITTEGEAGVTANLQKKQRKADEMFAALIAHMNDSHHVQTINKHTKPMTAPAWL